MSFNNLLRSLYRTYPFRKGRNRLRALAMQHVKGIAVGEDQFGNRMLFDLDSLMDCIVFLDGSNEKEAMLELHRWAESNPCDTMIDIGANIGCFSLFFAQLPKIQRVYAFEPDPGNHAQLMANIWLNHRQDKVEPFALALSSESGTASFFRPKTRQDDEFGKYNRGTSGLDRYPRRHDGSEQVSVSKRRLDDVLNLRGRTIAVKIDVEGHELSVLQGMTDLLRNNHCGLMIEVWERNRENYDRVTELLVSLGYQRVNISLEHETHLFVKAITSAKRAPAEQEVTTAA